MATGSMLWFFLIQGVSVVFFGIRGSMRQTCRPSRAEKGLKDWANVMIWGIQVVNVIILGIRGSTLYF
jgi:hypothetical protein